MPVDMQSYIAVKKPLLRLLNEIMDVGDNKPWHIYLTGHSMGGALATLAAYELSVRPLSQMHTPCHPSMHQVSMPTVEGLLPHALCSRRPCPAARLLHAKASRPTRKLTGLTELVSLTGN